MTKDDGFACQAQDSDEFTAYNREEAKSEAKILKKAGAKLVTSLGPKGKYPHKEGAEQSESSCYQWVVS